MSHGLPDATVTSFWFVLSMFTLDRPTCECLTGCPVVICVSWEVVVSTDVKMHTDVHGFESFSQ